MMRKRPVGASVRWRRSLRWPACAIVVALLASCGEKSKSGDAAADSVRAAAPRTSPEAAVAAPGSESAEGRRQVVFAGTSLTAGLGLQPLESYPHLVQQKIDSAGLPFVVVNAGVSGETTAGLLRRLGWLTEQPFDVMVIESGANDGLRALDVSIARENLSRILEQVRAANPDAAVILVSMEAPPNLGARYTAEFRQMYADLAQEHRVVLMPFLLEGVAGDPSLNQADGIHPNPAGARRMAENVWGVLEPILARRAAGG